jgi:hypothetical protein
MSFKDSNTYKHVKKVLPDDLDPDRIIMFGPFGSRLYGMDTPKSDMDFKGIYIPSLKELILKTDQRTYSKKSNHDEGKNTNLDFDTQIFSLQHFIKLACNGETEPIDMLHVPKQMLIVDSVIWEEITKHRRKFYSKNMKGLIGYVRKQASRYGVRGSRLNALKKVIEFFQTVGVSDSVTIIEIWNELPKGEHIHFFNEEDPPMYQVCGRKLQATVSIKYAIGVLQKVYDSYGSRAKLAAENQGIDWKAVAHAMRVAHEMNRIATVGDITFPLSVAKDLTEIKMGLRDYNTEVLPIMETLIEQAEDAIERSDFPNEVDREFWNGMLLKFYTTKNNGWRGLYYNPCQAEYMPFRNK